MDPFRKPALQSAKISLHTSSSVHRPQTHTSSSTSSSAAEGDMPPAYHMVVDPNMPIPNLRSPYAHEEEDDDAEKEEEDDIDTPEIIINASTQIRGHGNIISIAQMDSVRIATLITSLLNGEGTEKEKTQDIATPSSPPQTAAQAHTSRTQVRGIRKYPKSINITVNCGATIIGDRNIVGPGLGDIARQMQMAQRNQAAAAAAAQGKGVPSPSPSAMPQYHGVVTPPMSRSGSLGSEGGKRKAPDEDGVGGEGSVKRQC